MTPDEKSPNRLLVEGNDDKHSVIHLLKRHGTVEDDTETGFPYIHVSGSIEKILESLSASAKTYKRLGILVDADNNPSKRWEQLRNRLLSLGIEAPDDSVESGFVSFGFLSHSLIGVWVMPDNRSPGMLEDFIATLIPFGDNCWPYAKEVTEIAKKKGAPYREGQEAKAEIHTWLAWQEEPGRPIGVALTARYFEKDSTEALAFVEWFRRLFLNPLEDVRIANGEP